MQTIRTSSGSETDKYKFNIGYIGGELYGVDIIFDAECTDFNIYTSLQNIDTVKLRIGGADIFQATGLDILAFAIINDNIKYHDNRVYVSMFDLVFTGETPLCLFNMQYHEVTVFITTYERQIIQLNLRYQHRFADGLGREHMIYQNKSNISTSSGDSHIYDIIEYINNDRKLNSIILYTPTFEDIVEEVCIVYSPRGSYPTPTKLERVMNKIHYIHNMRLSQVEQQCYTVELDVHFIKDLYNIVIEYLQPVKTVYMIKIDETVNPFTNKTIRIPFDIGELSLIMHTSHNTSVNISMLDTNILRSMSGLAGTAYP
ncbi:MAG: hypothetical protein Faunusvirus1_50 [Faunusvirus sp.]|uniref:Uncharacterized protein n=1 Tax=Faunusvirus sp. TaxID=2487766 RepID=A0A3G4ZW04_9VIRU|nr:MAG: hypothetical protein Faunusvirus1_50 [Faunusvirus sp.]